MTSKALLRAAKRYPVGAVLILTGVAAATTMLLMRRRRAPTSTGAAAVSQSAFDQARGQAPPVTAGIGESRSDRELFEQVSAPNGYGPAPGGYGPASAPAGAHGGSGIFGAEGAGGGPGNDVEGDAHRDSDRQG